MNDNKFNKLRDFLANLAGSNRVKINEPLALHTTFRIGGPARIYFQVNELKELTETIKEVRRLELPFVILGGGTNVLVSDKGVSSLVIKNNCIKILVKRYGGTFISKKVNQRVVEIEVESGAPMNQLVRFTLDEDLTGLEAFLGQPGTVGGATYINAHNMKLGEFFGDKIISAKILTPKNQIKTVTNSYFNFGYDKSILQKSKDIVLSVCIELKKGIHDKIWSKADEALNRRRSHQPWGVSSAGCIFRNISKADSLRIGLPDGITSAGYLIEAVGLKGFQIGGAKVSEKHANFIINIQNAKCSDVEALITMIKNKVKERYGLNLTEEIVRIGDF